MSLTLAQLESDAAAMIEGAPSSRRAVYRPPGVKPGGGSGTIVRVLVNPGAGFGRMRPMGRPAASAGRGGAPPAGAGANRRIAQLVIASSVWRAAAAGEHAKEGKTTPVPFEPALDATFAILDADDRETARWRVAGHAEEHGGMLAFEATR